MISIGIRSPDFGIRSSAGSFQPSSPVQHPCSFCKAARSSGLASHFSEAVPELVIFVIMTAFGFAFPVITGFIFFGTLALLALALLIP
ncbi:hypothetical protein [uncultured Cohaesibacter sp.]|uniref:hypothetical protein n=1 Tax=uncultured Cohaesibacter sp. TaxID=1002546 RepID=UPI0037487440